MQLITIIGICASVFTSVSLLPQLFKIVKEKKAENISVWMMVMLFGGLGLWIYYGFLKDDLILIVANAFSFLTNLLMTIFSLRYKKRG